MKDDIWAETQPGSLDALPASAARSPLLDAKVMMVDDEPMMTDLVQVLLEDEGYTNFVGVNDPTEAVKLLRIDGPSVVLLDLMMPQMSGFEVLELIRANKATRYIPVIVLTASTGAAAKLRALQLGATDFLSKPVDGSELVLRVRNALAFFQYNNRLLNFDAVTGLPNRNLFDRGIDDILSSSEVGGMLVLMSIYVPECEELGQGFDKSTVDSFVNVIARRLHRFAHQDRFLSPFATSIERAPRLARVTDSLFCIAFEGLTDVETIEPLAKQILELVTEPITLGLHEVVPTSWIGIAMAHANGNGNGGEALRSSAELASTHAHENGVARYFFASPELNARFLERITLGAQLRWAAERDELRVFYQPKVEISSGRIIGVEALVRWQHPDHGLLQPTRFIGLAEELGLVGVVGEWVLQKACRDVAQWDQLGLGQLKVAINVAKFQFTESLCPLLQRTLKDSGLSPSQLIVELTESSLMDDFEAGRQMMLNIKALGVTLSIDDFGTGYSSLAYLKSFPLDELKIDRSFVVDLPGSASDVAVVHTIIDLGHRLNMSVIAEGVESSAQLACLSALGCDSFQGYLISKPIPSSQFVELLQTENTRFGSIVSRHDLLSAAQQTNIA